MTSREHRVDDQAARIEALEAENEALTATIERLQRDLSTLTKTVTRMESLKGANVSTRVC